MAKDSDSEDGEPTPEEALAKLQALRALTREERVAQVLAAVLTETEVEYLIGTLRKNKTKRTIDDLSLIYLNAKHTFHVIMCELGQMQTYEHIMGIYQENVHEDNLKETTMKLLLRCTYGYDSIERCRVIFKMRKRHQKLYEMLKVDEKLTEVRFNKKRLNQFQNKNRSKITKPKEKTEKEGKVAYLCLHASRLYIQTASFVQESLHITH